MSSWKYDKLSNICSKIGDGLHGTPKYVINSDIYFINGNNLKNGWIEISKNTKCVSDKELASNYIPLDKNTLLLSINGTLGNMAFYRNEKVILGKSSAYLNFKTGINKFYYYYFQLPSVQQYFFNVATGSTIKNLSLKSIQDFFVPVPEYHEWNSIASILSSLDAKIELNNRINTELEAMAKALYDYWFVQFDFPDDRGLPYRSSGGRMVWNEELKREVPEGWEVKNILSISDLLGGGTPKTQITEYWGGEIPFYTPSDAVKSYYVLETEKSISESGLNSCSSRLFPKGTIFLTARGTVGAVNISAMPMAMNQSCYALQAKSGISKYYLHQLSLQLVEFLKKKANGSIFDAIVSNDIKLTSLVIAPVEIINKYGSLVESYYRRVLIINNENRQLSSLRDWLLPMLMNGQVRVG